MPIEASTRTPELQGSESFQSNRGIPVLVTQSDSMGTEAPVHETLVDFTLCGLSLAAHLHPLSYTFQTAGACK